MTRSPLVAALLSLSLAFQLLLASGGPACIDADHGAMHPADSGAGEGMAGMDMATDTPMPGGDNEAPCDQPATPGACQLMGPCSISFIAIAVVELDRPALVSPRAVGTIALAPHSRTIAPELPPPRV